MELEKKWWFEGSKTESSFNTSDSERPEKITFTGSLASFILSSDSPCFYRVFSRFSLSPLSPTKNRRSDKASSHDDTTDDRNLRSPIVT